MVDLAVLQTVSYLIAALSLAVTCTYYIINLRNTQKATQLTLETRQAQLFQSVYSRFSSKEVLSDFNMIMSWQWRDYDDFIDKYGPTKPENYIAFGELANFFEGLGIYLKRGLFGADIIDDFLSGPIRIFWEKMKPVVVEHRKRENWSSYLEWVEYLYDEMHPIALKQHPELKPTSK